MELHRLADQAALDIVMFLGVDGRMFSSYVPVNLTMKQFNLLSLVKGNLGDICSQLRRENLKMAMTQYKDGTVLISGVGGSAFIIAIVASDVSTSQVESKLNALKRGAQVINHVFELRPMGEKDLAGYPDEVRVELEALGKQLFKERFTQTKDYKKNQDILEMIKAKMATVVGKGAVGEIVEQTFNEMGLRMANMDRGLWMMFLENVIKKHISRLSGPIVAEECLRTWIPEIESKLKSFV
jgi:cation transport regulator ChaB